MRHGKLGRTNVRFGVISGARVAWRQTANVRFGRGANDGALQALGTPPSLGGGRVENFGAPELRGAPGLSRERPCLGAILW